MPVPFSDEQSRASVNIEQHYRAWMDAERELARLPYDLRRKEIAGRVYLYEIRDRSGNGTSLGPWSAELEARFEAYREQKDDAKQRRDGARVALDVSARLYRAVRLPLLASEAGAILREADRRELLGNRLIVVGTNAMPAYALEAGALIPDAPDETDDFDMAWSGEPPEATERVVWEMLKSVDATFSVNTERPFQARNAKAYEVELLVAPSRAATMARSDRPQPVPLPEQEWLLEGRPVDHVVVCRDGSPARIVAPDPRWFALHKLWMAEKPARNPLKKPKDAKQGHALLDAVALSMPHYALDDAFAESLPAELAPHFSDWARNRPSPRPQRW